MPVLTRAQFGYKAESTYNTPVVVDKFVPYKSESVQLQKGSAISRSLGFGSRVPRVAGYRSWILGASGSLEIDLWNRHVGGLLAAAWGTSATSGPTDSAFTHTFTEGTPDPLTIQFNRPFTHDADQAFTYAGAKITGGTLSMAPSTGADLGVGLTLNFDCASEATATALATSSYGTGLAAFDWRDVDVKFDGTSVNPKSFTFSWTTPLDTARHKLKASSTKDEPVENDWRQYSLTGVFDFSTDLAMYNRFKNGTTTDVQIIIQMETPLIGVSSKYKHQIDADNVQLTGSTPVVGGPGLLELSMPGDVWAPASGSAVTWTMVTTDATV